MCQFLLLNHFVGVDMAKAAIPSCTPIYSTIDGVDLRAISVFKKIMATKKFFFINFVSFYMKQYTLFAEKTYNKSSFLFRKSFISFSACKK